MHYKLVSLLLELVSVTAANCQTDTKRRCSSTKTTTVDIVVAVNSHYNETGHWISEVNLEQERATNRGGLDVYKKPSWTVNLAQMSEKCQGTTTKHIMQLTFIAPPPKLNADYEYYPGMGHYKYYSNAESWPRAREICAEDGAELAIINSEKEAEVLSLIFSQYPPSNTSMLVNTFWVGAYEELSVPRQFVISNGNSLNTTGFVRWASGQPDPATIGKGAYLVFTRANGGLAVVYRYHKIAFICELYEWY